MRKGGESQHIVCDEIVYYLNIRMLRNDKYDIHGIVQMHANRKDDIFMQRRLYIDKAHRALDIFH